MRKILWLTMDEEWDNRVLLLKYQPKFYRKVQFSHSDWNDKKLCCKFRRIKVIQSLENLTPHYNPTSLILSAFKSQRHQLKKLALSSPIIFQHFPHVSNYTLSLKDPKSWKIFLKQIHIKNLGVIRPSTDSTLNPRRNLKPVKGFQWRFWSHFEKLRDLKSLDIRLYHKFDTELYDFFVKLNSQRTVLESLSSFSLFLNYLNAPLQDDLGFINIYKNLTSLRIHELSYSSLEKFLKGLGNCQRLSYLNLLKTFRHAQEEQDTGDLTFLGQLSGLRSLETIDMAFNLNSQALLSHFLEHFSLPKKILSLKISLYETDWNNSEDNNLFENLQDFNQFYSQWNDLENLESLSLCFYETGSLYTPTLYFISPILKRQRTLKSFYYANWCNALSEKIKPLDFSYLWQSISHLKGTIKKISVESFAISLRKFSRNLAQDDFQLHELSLCGFVFGDINLKNCINLFKSAAPTVGMLALDIEHLVIDDENSFTEVLNTLRNASYKLQTFLNLDVRKLNGSDFVRIACKLIPLIPHKSPINLKFSQIPQLAPQDNKEFKRMLIEYSRSRRVESQEAQQERSYQQDCRLFEGFGGDTRNLYEGMLNLGDEEEEETEENLYEEEEEEDLEMFRNYEDDVSSEFLGDSMEFSDDLNASEDRFNDIDEML